MKIIYGTSNKGKIESMKRIVKENNIDIEIVTSKDIGFDKDIVEDGTTFEENSEIKAIAIAEYCNQNNIKGIVITDDAGLCIDKLNGEPGVYSARYAGDHAPQIDCINKILDKMKQYENMEDRTAKFVCVLTAIILETGEKIVARGESKGSIAKEHGRLGGLTYVPIFIPEGFNEPMSEMTEKTYASVHNHRDLAMKKIIENLKERKIL